MTVVIDASLVLAGVTDDGSQGHWALEQLQRSALIAPQLLPVEVVSGLRRLSLAGRLRQANVENALSDVSTLDVELYPFLPLRDRVWELRDNLTAYDAWYVALAEAHDCPLATLDHRLVAAAGPRCEFVTPQG